MKDKVINALGLSRSNEYIRRYFDMTNMRSVIYMSVVVILLESWMIVESIRRIVSGSSSFDIEMAYLPWYFLLISTAIVMLVLAVRFVLGKMTNRWPALVVMVLFSVICMVFGVHFGLSAYGHGVQVFAFITMAIYVLCLLTWRPIVSFVASAVVFGAFYYLCSQTDVGVNYSFQVNFFTVWISVFMVALASYFTTHTRALQSESIEEANRRLLAISYTDELTGIANSRRFREDVNALFDEPQADSAVDAQGYVSPYVGRRAVAADYVMLYCDIEGFKHYNDKMGFDAGDELLKNMANTAVEVFAGDPVARVGDDHYAICTRASEYDAKLSRFEEATRNAQTRVRMALKTGIYRLEEDGVDAGSALDRARSACASIKRKSDQDRREFDEPMREEIRMQRHVLNHLDEAVAGGWIKAYFQPVMRLEDNTLYGLEALARWEDPDYGLLPPFRFIPVLETYRQIHKIDCCIIDQVCAEISTRLTEEKPIVPVSVNLSRLDFELCDIVDYILERCEHYGVPHEYLDIEVTESALSDDTGVLHGELDRLRNAGFSLWLDDFGSGYSSLNVLKEYQFDVLKVDMVFLRDFDTNSKARPLLAMIIDLANELGMLPLTEGVETAEQRDFLADIGCKRGQGYLFSRPLPVADMHEAIESGALPLP